MEVFQSAQGQLANSETAWLKTNADGIADRTASRVGTLSKSLYQQIIDQPLNALDIPNCNIQTTYSINHETSKNREWCSQKNNNDHISPCLIVPRFSRSTAGRLFSLWESENKFQYRQQITSNVEDQSDNLKYFANDFGSLKKFFKTNYYTQSDYLMNDEPGQFNNAISFELVKFLQRNVATRRPKREQMFKKVLNYCFKNFVNDYKRMKQPKLQHLNSQIKIEFLNEFFPKDEHDNLKRFFPLINNDARKQFFTYKSNFLNFIKENQKVKERLTFYMDKLMEESDRIFEKDLYRFLLQIEHWLDRFGSHSTDLNAFFDQKQKTRLGQVKTTGVKLPWSEEQLINAVKTLRLQLV
jgi:hypothetical protein